MSIVNTNDLIRLAQRCNTVEDLELLASELRRSNEIGKRRHWRWCRHGRKWCSGTHAADGLFSWQEARDWIKEHRVVLQDILGRPWNRLSESPHFTRAFEREMRRRSILYLDPRFGFQLSLDILEGLMEPYSAIIRRNKDQ